jgi:arginase family enzyme
LIEDPWIDPDDPTVIKLNPDDPLLDKFNERRDLSAYPKREPGLINVHRHNLHMENVGVPTFFRRPMALTPEDLKAAKVDVAVFGAPMGWMSPAGAGNHSGPMFVRAQFGNGMYGSQTAPLSPIEVETLIEPFNVLNVVDEDLEGKDLVYLTFDIDVFDMSYAPGTGSSEPTGLSPNQLFPQLRRLCAAKRIVGADIVEYKRHMDNPGLQTGRLVRRTAITIMTGIAMNAMNMDPEYVNPHHTGELNK